MEYREALAIGRERAEDSAELIQRWTGVEAMALCAVRPGRTKGQWEPVGLQSLKEIALDGGYRHSGRYSLLVVDERGTVKACSRELFPLGEVLRLADRLPMRVAMPGTGELWQRLREEDERTNVRDHALRVEA